MKKKHCFRGESPPFTGNHCCTAPLLDRLPDRLTDLFTGWRARAEDLHGTEKPASHHWPDERKTLSAGLYRPPGTSGKGWGVGGDAGTSANFLGLVRRASWHAGCSYFAGVYSASEGQKTRGGWGGTACRSLQSQKQSASRRHHSPQRQL